MLQKKKTFKALLVENHNLVREAFRYLLYDLGITDITEADNGKLAVELAKRDKPSLVIMDLKLPGLDGMEASRQIKELDKDIKILGITIHSDKQTLKKAISSGIDGLVLKSSEALDLEKAISSIMSGQKYADSKTTAILFGIVQDKNDKTLLTEKEKEVLRFGAEGFSNKEIANQMGLAIYTIKDHWKNIFTKLGASDRAHAVSIALRNKIIE